MQKMKLKVKKHTQDQVIRFRINQLLDEGITDKKEILDKVEKETQYPRATIRRSAKKLRDEMTMHLTILSVDVADHKDGWNKYK